MAEQGALSNIFGSFHRTFWVVNSFELLERGAYYGTLAVLSVHVIKTILGNAGYAGTVWGVLYGMVTLILYFFPLPASTFAEKFGFKRVLLAAFALEASGYFVLSTTFREGQFLPLAVGFSMVGFGAGLYKPVIGTTIAHVTSTEQRNQAYSIYYWMINLGAFLVPLSVGFAFPERALYHYVFAVSSVLVALNLVTLLLFFKNPVAPQPDLAVAEAIKRVMAPLADRKFAVLLVIYAGFWFMYTYTQTFLPVLMVDFGRMPDWVALAWISTVNPGTIIALGPFLGKLVERYKSINVMMTGIALACIGIAVNGMSDASSLFFVGIVIFSIGEFITHPGFIAYVSKVAPKDKLTSYMASIFLSIGIGTISGSVAQGVMYDHFARGLLRPKAYIAICVAIGLATLLAFILYNRWVISGQVRADPTHREPPSVWTRAATMGVVLILIPATLGGGLVSGTSVLEEEGEAPRATDWSVYASATLPIDDVSDYTNEGDEWGGPVEVGVPNVARMRFTLTWTDEADAGVRYTNQPDTFELAVTPPNGTERTSGAVANAQGGEGTASVSFEFEGAKDPFWNGTGEWGVVVRCATAGDQTPLISPFNRRVQADDGNAWTLSVECVHLERPAK